MNFRRLLVALILMMVATLPGCGGGNEPVNAGKDMPVPPPKKDKPN